MIRLAKLLSILALVSLGASAEAQGATSAAPVTRRRAPEPVTLIGLGIGASAIGIARWRSKRKGK
jgi:hypothetical protein